MTEEQILTLTLNPMEVLSTANALYWSIVERLDWATDSEHWYRNIPLQDAQDVFNASVAAYQQFMLAAQSIQAPLIEGWIESFSFTPDEWKQIDVLTLASEWKDVPTT